MVEGDKMKKLITSFLFLTTSFLSFSEIILDSSNIKPAINEAFTIQVKFINEDKKDYEIEGIENLQVLSQGTQSKFSYINGDKTSEKIDTYTVLPKDIKNFPLTVKLKNGNEKSNTLNIEVQKENTQNLSKDIVVETSLDKKKDYYFGEKIIYEENLLTTVSINSLGYSQRPQFNQLSEKDISPVNNNGNYPQEYFRDSTGKQGLKINLYRGILQPNYSGKIDIKSGQVRVTQSTGRRDFFFEESTPPKYFGGKNIELNILPLPTDAPAGFQNVVGKPKLDYSWNTDEINYGDSLVLTLKISGEVNLDSLEKIITKDFKDFNVFESIKSSNESILGGVYNSEKNFELAFIPKKNGELTIPEISIPYFDTGAKTYKFLVVPEKKIVVNGSVQQNLPSTTQISSTTSEVKKDNPPLEEIKIETIENSEVTENLFSNKLYNIMIIGLLVLVVVEGGVIFYLINKGRKKSFFDINEMKNAKDDREFYEAYCSFMKKKYNFSPKVHLEDRLVKLGLSPEFIEINGELESSYFNNTPINRKNILNRIKKELKNEK